ncbi:MAG: hypothetical protein ACT4N2_03210 [Hyphomicrobium sp.]
MGMRFKFLSAVYLVLMLVSYHTDANPIDGVSEVFVGLASLLVLSVIALWPNSERADRVDRAMSGSSWADRIDFDKIPR